MSRIRGIDVRIALVIDERRDLSDKLGKLNGFLVSMEDVDGPSLPPLDTGLLIAQAKLMMGYMDILDRRLARIDRSNQS